MITKLLFVLIVSHITVIGLELYLHRGLSHRAVNFHPILSHFFRLYLWLTYSLVTRQWLAIHRLHHMYSDTDKDPHENPRQLKFFWTPITYRKEKWNINKVDGEPDDWLEHNLYSKYYLLGLCLMFVINILLFQWWGILTFVSHLILGSSAIALITSAGHLKLIWGYRNYNTADSSYNYMPIGLFWAGSELHNNHHAEPNNPKMSRKWWEFDIGWAYLKFFNLLGLVTINEKIYR